MKIRHYGKVGEITQIPDLRDLQFKSYSRFLQKEVPSAKRQNVGLEAIIREIFPIKSYDGSLSLVYLSYDLGQPRYRESVMERFWRGSRLAEDREGISKGRPNSRHSARLGIHERD